jgi:dihydrofolate reductase
MKYFKAIAAMSENRVIGNGNQIPWHLPEDFKWFKKMTMGNVVVLGRKTFEAMGKPLLNRTTLILILNRTTLILTRRPRHLINNHPEIFGDYREWRGGKRLGNYLKRPYQLYFTKIDGDVASDIVISNSLDRLNPEEFPTDIFICGGAQIYEQALPRCSDLFLTRVKRTVEGDAFFPAFESLFGRLAIITDTPEFTIEHWRHARLM